MIEFQHTATRRWLHQILQIKRIKLWFQHTATRRWLPHYTERSYQRWCFNTQPPEGGCKSNLNLVHQQVIRFNTQPPEGGCKIFIDTKVLKIMFQHTATRRWLLIREFFNKKKKKVSTHSHPKVAANARKLKRGFNYGFNTQPPEGGCIHYYR